MTAEEVIKKFDLIPLPEEGGFFREIFKDPLVVRAGNVERSAVTSIYYLVTPEEFSGLHAVKSTEIFHFYAGDPVEMVQINPEGDLKKITLGNSLFDNHQPQEVVPPLIWQGTKLLEGGEWALLGCTVSPGFEYEDFINGTYEELSKLFPQHNQIIKQYTH